MDEDKRLLELAAKAAGVCLHPEDQLHHSYGNWGCDTTCMVCKKDPCRATWHPLTNDGDALRLAVQCGLEISFVNEDGEDRACVGYPTGKRSSYYPDGDLISYVFEDHLGDIFAATRRCIVRAAAAIGEAMP